MLWYSECSVHFLQENSQGSSVANDTCMDVHMAKRRASIDALNDVDSSVVR